MPFIKGMIPWNKGKPFLRGKANPFYGKHHTEETKQKMRGHRKPRGPMPDTTKKRISKTLTGRKFSFEHRRNLSKAYIGNKNCLGRIYSEETKLKIATATKANTPRGEKHHNWQGDKSFEPYSPEFNNDLKQAIKKRDGYKCQECGILESESIAVGMQFLDVHHIDYNKKNSLPYNLITLCKHCSGKANFNRNYWERHFGEKMKQPKLVLI